MNAIDGLFKYAAKFLKAVSKYIPQIDIPFEKYGENWSIIQGHIEKANVFLPIDTFITIMGIIMTFVGVMIIIWLISFILEFIPFF